MNATSGALLFSSDAVDFSTNPALQWKLGLIVLAGINALLFQLRIQPQSTSWDRDIPAPTIARASAAISIALWLAVIVAGRMIAYVK